MSIRRKNVAISVEEHDMSKKNVGIFIPSELCLVQTLISHALLASKGFQ
jgi:hypothetical protein